MNEYHQNPRLKTELQGRVEAKMREVDSSNLTNPIKQMYSQAMESLIQKSKWNHDNENLDAVWRNLETDIDHSLSFSRDKEKSQEPSLLSKIQLLFQGR